MAGLFTTIDIPAKHADVVRECLFTRLASAGENLTQAAWDIDLDGIFEALGEIASTEEIFRQVGFEQSRSDVTLRDTPERWSEVLTEALYTQESQIEGAGDDWRKVRRAADCIVWITDRLDAIERDAVAAGEAPPPSRPRWARGEH